mgnify:CR=1 FL=1|tara:strand:- start:230 stop:406 length:177 start_codon:yes stop_codon:yes gene_type:complete
MKKENRETTYIWTEPKTKDPGADYKPGKFKHLDEAIKNTKKMTRISKIVFHHLPCPIL